MRASLVRLARTMSRQQPAWSAPTPSTTAARKLPPLSIYNSLTRSKNAFVPLDPASETVTWYSCGPTVYDDAHLGHARNYMAADIIRRLMRDYFRFKVNFVMNITDVDDKVRETRRAEGVTHSDRLSSTLR